MKKVNVALTTILLSSTIALSGCANMTPGQRIAAGVVGGAIIGAGVGALITNTWQSAGIGAAIGAVGGGVVAHETDPNTHHMQNSW